MTNEEKQLLLQDLSMRLPYKPMLELNNGVHCKKEKLWTIDMEYITVNSDWSLEDVKPYLRSLSSMTEKEKSDFSWIAHKEYDGYDNNDCPIYTGNFTVDCDRIDEIIDFFNSHRLDFRGLIKKKLALEEPEGMYETPEEKWDKLKKKQAENIAKLAEKHPKDWFFSGEMKKPFYQRTGFAPHDGKCYNCGRNIAEGITLEDLGDYIITGCPFCNYSFCD